MKIDELTKLSEYVSTNVTNPSLAHDIQSLILSYWEIYRRNILRMKMFVFVKDNKIATNGTYQTYHSTDTNCHGYPTMIYVRIAEPKTEKMKNKIFEFEHSISPVENICICMDWDGRTKFETKE